MENSWSLRFIPVQCLTGLFIADAKRWLERRAVSPLEAMAAYDVLNHGAEYLW